MNKKSIFVAGATGLVGSHLMEVGTKLGYTMSGSKFRSLPKVQGQYEKYDFSVMDECLRATKDKQTVIISAALVSGISGKKKNPTQDLLVNANINLGLLEACRINHVETIVLISSTSVYQSANFQIKESELNLNLPPSKEYLGVGNFNRFLEAIAIAYKEYYGIRFIVIRPSAVYGKYDHFDSEFAHVIPSLIRRAVKGEDPFVVWGDGTEIRDFVFADDVALDIFTLLEGKTDLGPVNSGCGNLNKVSEVVENINQILGSKLKVKYDISKPVSIPFRGIDISIIRNLEPDRSRILLKEGLQQTIEWYLKFA